jgi:cytoskeletal protein CcmA (bactofilin family)
MEPDMFNADALPRPDGRAPQNPPPSGRQGEERRMVAWVGKSLVFKGDLTSSEDMMIDGRFEGSIELPDHMLTIGPDADIKANIVARAVIIHGTVTGKITASEKVDIRDTGSIDGDVFSPRLAIADGAILRGRVDTEGGETSRKDRTHGVTTH